MVKRVCVDIEDEVYLKIKQHFPTATSFFRYAIIHFLKQTQNNSQNTDALLNAFDYNSFIKNFKYEDKNVKEEYLLSLSEEDISRLSQKGIAQEKDALYEKLKKKLTKFDDFSTIDAMILNINTEEGEGE